MSYPGAEGERLYHQWNEEERPKPVRPPYISFQELSERMMMEPERTADIFVWDIIATKFRNHDMLLASCSDGINQGMQRTEPRDGRRTIIIRITIDEDETT